MATTDGKGDYKGMAENYNHALESLLGPYGKDIDRFAEYKIKLLRDLIKDSPQNILDFGCGVGRSLEFIKKYFGSPDLRLFGCDVYSDSLEYAKAVVPDADFYLDLSPEVLYERKEKYDFVFVSCVFHHLDFEERTDWAKAIIDNLNPNGYLAVFEHNLANPVTKKIIMDPENVLDNPEYMLSQIELESLLLNASQAADLFWSGYTLFSPVRFSGVEKLEKIFKRIPLGAQHLVVIRKKG